MTNHSIQPRILLVTPEASFVPTGSDIDSDSFNNRPGRYTNFWADLIIDLLELGVDVHVAQPDYRRIFADSARRYGSKEAKKIPKDRVNLTEDRIFFYTKQIDSNYCWENTKISLAFQREIINHVIAMVQPDLIHCYNWMTGLIPAVARSNEIPCIFTVQNLDTAKIPLSYIEDVGIDGAAFWQYLFFERFPVNYEETRESNPIDFLLSGIFAAKFVNVAEPAFAGEMNKDRSIYSELLNQILVGKLKSGSEGVNKNPSVGAQKYIDLYEKMLRRPVIKASVKKSRLHDESPYADVKLNKTDNEGSFAPYHSTRMAS